MAWVAEVKDRVILESSGELALTLQYYDDQEPSISFRRQVLIKPGMTQAQIVSMVREKGEELRRIYLIYSQIEPGTRLTL